MRKVLISAVIAMGLFGASGAFASANLPAPAKAGERVVPLPPPTGTLPGSYENRSSPMSIDVKLVIHKGSERIESRGTAVFNSGSSSLFSNTYSVSSWTVTPYVSGMSTQADGTTKSSMDVVKDGYAFSMQAQSLNLETGTLTVSLGVNVAGSPDWTKFAVPNTTIPLEFPVQRRFDVTAAAALDLSGKTVEVDLSHTTGAASASAGTAGGTSVKVYLTRTDLR